VFYLCKSDESLVTPKLIKASRSDDTDAVLDGSIRQIELFKLDNSPLYFEEDFNWKAANKRTHSEMVKAEAEGGPNAGRPMPFVLTKLQQPGEEDQVSSLFDPILSEIREYLENLNKAEEEVAGEEE